MNIERQRELLKFKRSIINLVINIIHVLLFFMTIGGYALFFVMIILLSGFSMWQSTATAGMPIRPNLNNSIENISTTNIYLVDLEDGNLRYEVYANITVPDDYTIDIDGNYGILQHVYLDNQALVFDPEVGYVIPEGTYNLKLEISNSVDIDTYKGVTSVEIYLPDFSHTTLSSYFRRFSPDQEQSIQSVTLITASSTGKYVPKIYRSPMFQAVIKVQQILVIYTVLNVIKIIVLFVLTKDARFERKRAYHRS